jgi:tocopherol cyclase
MAVQASARASSLRATMLAAYRRTGADPPFGDPRGYHDVGMEGWYWRFTDVGRGTVVVVLLAISRDARGERWGMVGLAAHPGSVVRSATAPWAAASRRGIDVVVGAGEAPLLRARHDRLQVDLGADARLEATLTHRRSWPGGAFGGIGPAQVVPGLSQYWHPHLLHARARGVARVGAATIDLDGAAVYAEKNWGRGGMPPAWWWGQAHGFGRDDACVAFAGGRAGVGAARVVATALVVAAGGEVVRLVRPLTPLRVAVDGRGWRLRGSTVRHSVEIEGDANGTVPHLLPVPVPAERRRLDNWAPQHLAGRLHVRLRRHGRTVLDDVSTVAGLEHGRGAEG